MATAIRTKQLLSSPDEHINAALGHVFVAVHQASEPKEDWLNWICQVLDMIPALPLNARGKPKKPHRGDAKPRTFSRADFTAKLPCGLKPKEVTTCGAIINKRIECIQ